MLYTYEAVDQQGVRVLGAIEALDVDHAIQQLEQKKLIPVKVLTGKEERRARGLSVSLFEHITPLDRIFLIRNLAAIIRAGLNILEAVDIMIEDATKQSMRLVLIRAKGNLENGQPLSATFAMYPKIFPSIFVGMVRAGEESGQLADTLDELNAHLTREYGLTKKVRSALMYPAILLAGSFGIVMLLLTVVVPRLAKVFLQNNVDLPWVTQALLFVSNLVVSHPIGGVVVGIALIIVLIILKRSVSNSRFFATIIFHIPLVKQLVKKVILVRFTRTLGSLLASGTPLLEALQFAREAAYNQAYRSAIKRCIVQVTSGVPLSKAMAGFPDLFPRFLTSMLSVGERTSTTEKVLKTFAAFYDEEIDTEFKDLATVIEPVLLLVMGVIIGGLALAILVPIYQYISSVGG
ncbi:MAG: type II secretion system F family protein [Patescibacteria group bacterium]